MIGAVVDKGLGLVRFAALGAMPGVEAATTGRVDRWPHVERPRGGGRLVLGRRTRLFPHVGFYLESPEAVIAIGDRTFLNRRCEVIARSQVRIGSDCAIAWDVCITDTDNHAIADGDAPGGRPATAPVEIGDRVWVGARSMILKGVTIGDGSIIGAGSLVTRPVPPRCLAVGSPARVVRTDVDWVM